MSALKETKPENKEALNNIPDNINDAFQIYVQTSSRKLNNVAQQEIGRMVRWLGAERVVKTIYRRMELLLKAARTRALSSPIAEFIAGFGIAGSIYYAGSKGISGEMELNQFVSFLSHQNHLQARMLLRYIPMVALLCQMLFLRF